jgi:DNA-binding CsgD family transcriptional regulator
MGEGRALAMLSVTALHGGDHEAAEMYLEQSAGVARAANDSWSLRMSLNALGDIARLQGQTARATGFYAEALELPRSPGLVGTNAIILSNVAHLAHQEGEDLRAASLFAEALPDLQVHGREGDIIGCLIGIAGVSLGFGRAERAAQLLGAVEAGLARSSERLWPSNRDAYQRDLRRTQRALSEVRFDSAVQSSRAMGLDIAVQNAMALLGELINSCDSGSTMGQREHLAAGGALTRREREILRLVRRGLTNRQIAVELVIAEKTAINYVAHILDKLGVHSRVELLARASELGLEPPPT